MKAAALGASAEASALNFEPYKDIKYVKTFGNEEPQKATAAAPQEAPVIKGPWDTTGYT